MDPSGLLRRHSFLQPGHPEYEAGKLTLAYWVDGNIDRTFDFNDLDEFNTWAEQPDILQDIINVSSAGWELSGEDTTLFLAIKALEFMYVFSSEQISMLEDAEWTIANNSTRQEDFGGSSNGYRGTTIYWDPAEEFSREEGAPERHWNNFPAVAGLAHEMGHAYDLVLYGETTQESAIRKENATRYACYNLVQGYSKIWPRPSHRRRRFSMDSCRGLEALPQDILAQMKGLKDGQVYIYDYGVVLEFSSCTANSSTARAGFNCQEKGWCPRNHHH